MSGCPGSITPILTFPLRGGRDPHPAPLDACLCRNYERRGRPYAAPLSWVPAFAGPTMGVFGRASAVGCFGIGFVAGLAQFSYKSNNVFAEGQQPPPDIGRAHSDHRCGPCHRRSGWPCRRDGDPRCCGCGERLRLPWGDCSGGTGAGAMRPCQGVAARRGGRWGWGLLVAGGPSTGSGRTGLGGAPARKCGRVGDALPCAPLDSLDSQTKCNTRVGCWHGKSIYAGHHGRAV